MKNILPLLLAFVLGGLVVPIHNARAQGTALTYQGQLNDAAGPVNGSNDLTFTLYNAVSAGATVGTSNVFNDLLISNGLFTVTLDFGAGAFNGSARWLSIAVRPGASTGGYTNLAPRQPITPSPYAIFAAGASAPGVTGTLPAASLAGAYSGAVNFSNAANVFAGNGGRLTNLNTTNLVGTVADARLSANVVLLNGTNVFAGTNRFAGVVLATNFDNQIAGSFGGNGGGLTNLNTTNLVGMIADARLSTNVALLNGTNVFAGTNRFAGVVLATNANNQIVGSFSGNGGGFTNLNATNLVGAVADARLSTNVALLNRPVQAFTGGTNSFTGNVGIGTNTPQTALHVVGTVRATAFSGDGAGLINLPSSTVEPPANVIPVQGMTWIKPGTFFMGSRTNEPGRNTNEGPQTVVTITMGFWMGVHEVTQGEYQTVIGSNPSFYVGDTNRPVDSVNWNSATNYCRVLTTIERTAGRIPAGWGYRLPTEAEWEFACRAGARTTRFGYGDDLGAAALGNYAWYTANAGGVTHAVEQKLANPWGLMDMHGNVWEWCQDYFGTYSGGSTNDPQGAVSGPNRVMRGGTLNVPAASCRSAQRFSESPGNADIFYGFRTVLSSGQP